MWYCLGDLLKHEKESRKTQIALVDDDRRVTYGELCDLVERYATLAVDAGIRRGDRVALYLPRSVDLVAALFGVWRLGAVAVIVNDVLKSRQVNYIVDHSEASLLITKSTMVPARNDLTISQNRIFRIDKNPIPERAYTTSRDPIGADLALIIYTSGSTGMPKGIMLSHANILSGTFIISDYLRLTQDDIIISVLPFSFDYGLNQLMSALYVGGRLVIQRSVLPADICSTLTKEKVTGMGCVPMLWQQLAGDRSPFVKTSFPHLRYITNTGGKMPENVTRLISTTHPQVQIYLMFGLTEAFRSSYLPPEQVSKRPTSIGKAIPNVELLVINEQGEECKPGETGELIHRGANIAIGYWRDPEATARRFRPSPAQNGKGGLQEIAVYSGDYVKRDEEGYLYFVGRKDQMMKSHGMRVSPEEIEEPLLSSNLLSHVVAFSDQRNGTEGAIVAAIVPRDAKTFNEKELTIFCRKELPEYLRPGVFWKLDGFPQTSSGKPDRVALKEKYIQSQSVEKAR